MRMALGLGQTLPERVPAVRIRIHNLQLAVTLIKTCNMQPVDVAAPSPSDVRAFSLI